MLRTQIYLPEELHQTIKLLASRQKQTMASLVRRLIIFGIKEEQKKLPPKSLSQLTKLKICGGPKDLSNNMDKYLYQ